MMNETLRYAIEHDMLDLSYVQEMVEMNQKNEILEKHPYAIWQGKDERWYTHFPDKEKGRVLRQRKTEEELKDLIYAFWKEKSENPTLKDIFQQWISKKLNIKKFRNAVQTDIQQILYAFLKGQDFPKDISGKLRRMILRNLLDSRLCSID